MCVYIFSFSQLPKNYCSSSTTSTSKLDRLIQRRHLVAEAMLYIKNITTSIDGHCSSEKHTTPLHLESEFN